MRNSIRNLDRLFEDNINSPKFDDFNTLRISYNIQKSNVDSNSSAIRDESKSSFKKTAPFTKE